MNVWIFAEERSGSTWLATTLAAMGHVDYVYVEEDREHLSDDRWAEIVREEWGYYNRPRVYHTHRFAILNTLVAKRSDAVLLRCSRNDSLEHFISWVFLRRTQTTHPDWWRSPHLTRHPPATMGVRRAYFDRLLTDVGEIIVRREEFEAFTDMRLIRSLMWFLTVSNRQTIYYEDLQAGVAINDLGIDRIGFDMPGLIAKLPYDKRALVANYEEVQGWFSQLTNHEVSQPLTSNGVKA